jgi:hypothetical protein
LLSFAQCRFPQKDHAVEEIKRQVKRAQRRMVLQQFLTIVAWSLFASLLVGAIGLAIPKIWPLVGIDRQAWMWSWIAGSAAAGLAVAGIWTYVVRRSPLEAAIEIDRRFGLKERVSSTLALAPEELSSEIGQALVQDAVRRVERIDVREQFKIVPSWRNVLPLLPAVALALLPLLPDAVTKKADAANAAKENEKQQVKRVLEKMIQQQKRGTAQKQDTAKVEEGDFKKMFEKQLEKMASKDNLDRKNAMIDLNNLSKEIEKRKQQLGGADQLKRELEKLEKIDKGPAEKMMQALKEGNFEGAQKEMQKLQEKLKAGELSKEEEEKLAKQAEKLKEQIEQKMEAHKQARADLQRQIEQKIKEGNMEEAERLQQKLDKMNQEAQQMEQKMEQMAQNLDQLAEALKQGGKEGQQRAAQQMEQIARDLQDLQKDLAEMEQLDELMEQLADAKEAMKCENCNGEGCKQCQGGDGDQEGEGEDGKGERDGKNPGKGLGKGRGKGERPEEETDTKFYQSQVKGDPRKGESVRIGDAEGANAKGKPSLEVVREEIESGLKSKEPDATDDTALSRELKKHAKEYFEKFRKGEVRPE